MVGAVLQLELLLGSRRSRAYVFRWLYAGLLLAEIVFFIFWYLMEYVGRSFAGRADHFYITAFISEKFVHLFVTQQNLLLSLAVPALAAGAITEEKTSGTLQYLLTTDLTSWEIILGKLLGRLFQVAVLALVGLPLLCFFGAMGAIDFLTLVGVVAVSVLPMLALGSLSVLASVVFKQTRDAALGLALTSGLLTVLAFAARVWWGVPPIPFLDPEYVLEPIWGAAGVGGTAEFGWRLLGTSLGWISVVVVCLLAATWRLRPTYVRQLEGQGAKQPVRWWRVARAPIGENPVIWKERHVEGLAPVRALKQVPTWLAVLTVFLLTVAAGLGILGYDLLVRGVAAGRNCLAEALDALRTLQFGKLAVSVSPFEATDGMAIAFCVLCLAAMLLATLAVGIRCSGTITGERERKSWEPLLLTPLPTKKIVGGKLWGIMGSSYLYFLAYAVPALLLSMLGGIVCFGETVIGIGVTWLAMTFVGSAGVWCSVRAKSSWRSLLGTLGLGYVGGSVVYGVTTPFLGILTVFIAMALQAMVNLLNWLVGINVSSPAPPGGIGPMYPAFFIASCIGLASLFALLSWYFRYDAIKWVADRERTRFLRRDEPQPRPSPPAPRRRPPVRQQSSRD